MKKLYRIKDDLDIMYEYRGMLCCIMDRAYSNNPDERVTLELICSNEELNQKGIVRHPQCTLKYLEPVNLKNNYYIYK